MAELIRSLRRRWLWRYRRALDCGCSSITQRCEHPERQD